MLNGLLQVRDQHEITSLKPTTVQCVVIDVTQRSACAYAVSVVTQVDVRAQLLHQLRAARKRRCILDLTSVAIDSALPLFATPV